MEREPKQLDDDLPEIDFRCVTILWHEGAPLPEITYTASSIYEAIGLLRTAVKHLERNAADDFDGEDCDE